MIIYFVIFLLFAGLFLLKKVITSRVWQLFGIIVNKIKTEEKFVALTFDDGPQKGATEEIIEILKNENIKATFFLSGKDIEKNPVESKMIISSGHEIGNHAYSHKRMICMSTKKIACEIEKTENIIRKYNYKGKILFRPPYGSKLFSLPYYLNKRGIISILWSMEPDNYKINENTPEAISDHVIKNIHPGAIILMHVMYENRKPSLEAVPLIITKLKSEGYKFLTVSELLQKDSRYFSL